MSKILKAFGVAVVLLLIGAVAAWHYLPGLVVKEITKANGIIQIIPAKTKANINKKIDELPHTLKALEAEGIYISIDDIIREIDESEVDEITRTIGILENTELKSTDQVIRIVLNNMDFGKLENEKVVTIAKQKMKMTDVKKAMKMIRENGKPYALTIPMGKETLKGLLLEKKKEIEEKINS
ncbi:MAG: hypothetical protein SH857_03080 [Chitinophagales bacterium]|nr:hypothetical protein [Chitinophagales bacterium]